MNSIYIQAILLLLVLTVFWSAYVRYDIAMEMVYRRDLAEQKALTLKIRKDDLKKEVEYLTSERGIEAERRRQFDLEGEKVVVIVEKSDDGVEIMPLGTSTKDTDHKKWYQFWR